MRFTVFAIGGLWLTFFSGIMLFMRLCEHDVKRTLHPAAACCLLALAGLSILYGIGRWGRWLYLPVFWSCPFVFMAMMLGLSKTAPDSDKTGGTLFAIMAVILSLGGVWVVGRYYDRHAQSTERLR